VTPPVWRERLRLPDDGWTFELLPTLDNRHGDFHRPPSPTLIGAEARRLWHREAEVTDADADADWHRVGLDLHGWTRVAPTHGPKAWLLGPLPVGVEVPADQLQALSRLDLIARPADLCLADHRYNWSEYEFSEQWGVLDDPVLKHWATGPHGLKKQVPDEFIDLLAPATGMRWLLLTALVTDRAGPAVLVAGSRAAHAVWLAGQPLLARSLELPPGQRSQWKLLHYDAAPRRVEINLVAGATTLLVELWQPPGQRTRAYVAIDAPLPAQPPALRWFAGAPRARFNHRPQAGRSVQWLRCDTPPGVQGLTTLSCGSVQAWLDGVALVLLGSRQLGTVVETRWRAPQPFARHGQLALRVDAAPGARRGSALAGPVRFDCGPGLVTLDDWSRLGLADYAGAARYSIDFTLTAADLALPLALELGAFVASAALSLNGAPLAQVLTDDELVDLQPAARSGVNRLEIVVASALAQHFHAASPTPYFDPRQHRAGLSGPVRLLSSCTSLKSPP
ncbi:MAG: hypothetical protein H7242_22240, partial [Microbacteriaceae bacterium]|nr:hypothetical protein [Burkholderiaceae bacterium]